MFHRICNVRKVELRNIQEVMNAGVCSSECCGKGNAIKVQYSYRHNIKWIYHPTMKSLTPYTEKYLLRIRFFDIFITKKHHTYFYKAYTQPLH